MADVDKGSLCIPMSEDECERQRLLLHESGTSDPATAKRLIDRIRKSVTLAGGSLALTTVDGYHSLDGA